MPITQNVGVDQAGFAGRIRALLPTSWFPSTTAGDASESPVLDGVLAGYGSVWASLWQLLEYAVQQTRIASASDRFLELIASDYLGPGFLRKSGETDDAFRARIRAAIFQPAQTRAAISAALYSLTGYRPVIVEAYNPSDCGGWGSPAWGWGTPDAHWGSLATHNSVFVVAFRPAITAVPGVGGWGSTVAGWGTGIWRWITGTETEPTVTDADILATLVSTLAAGTVAWVRIENPVVGVLGPAFTLGSTRLSPGGLPKLGTLVLGQGPLQ